jgi:hypothetical protein
MNQLDSKSDPDTAAILGILNSQGRSGRLKLWMGWSVPVLVMDMQELSSALTGSTRVMTGLLGAVAAVLSCFGGIMGIVLGLSGSLLGASLLGVPFVLNSKIVVMAFLFSAAVGIVFGYFPALQAARLDPIEALRRE